MGNLDKILDKLRNSGQDVRIEEGSGTIKVMLAGHPYVDIDSENRRATFHGKEMHDILLPPSKLVKPLVDHLKEDYEVSYLG